MENKKWNLSDQIFETENGNNVNYTFDVKEFIRRLKERFGGGPTGDVDLEFIDKLAGKRLT